MIRRDQLVVGFILVSVNF